MKGNICGMTHKQSMKLFKRFFKRKQKKRKRGDKESLKQCFSSYTEMQDPLGWFFALEWFGSREWDDISKPIPSRVEWSRMSHISSVFTWLKYFTFVELEKKRQRKPGKEKIESPNMVSDSPELQHHRNFDLETLKKKFYSRNNSPNRIKVLYSFLKLLT